MRGGDQSPSFPGQPPLASGRHQWLLRSSALALGTSSPPCCWARLSKPQLDMVFVSLPPFIVSTHLNSKQGSSWGPRTLHHSLLQTPHPQPAQSCASLTSGPRTLCPPCKECAALIPHLAKSYSSRGFHLSLAIPSSRKPSFTPKVSLKCPLCAPNIPVSLKQHSAHGMWITFLPFRPSIPRAQTVLLSAVCSVPGT